MKLGNLPSVVGKLGVDLRDEERGWVRSAWCLDGETWRLRMLEIVAGDEPPGWDSEQWTYPNVRFAAHTLPGRVPSAWLGDGKVTIDGLEGTIYGPNDRLNWDRRESHAQTGYQVLEWPTYEVQLANIQVNEPPRPLLSDENAPSFASFYLAAASFFDLRVAPIGGQLPTGAVFRWVDTRARINSVQFADDNLRVEVEGQSLDGLLVELAGDAPGQYSTLETEDRTAVVNFPLPDGLPAGAWVVIRSGSEWLDRRFLTWPWARGQEHGVTVEVPARTKLDAFIAARENDTAEFKQSIPDADSTKAKVMKTVCAFANGSGGSILFGVTDDYHVVGLPAALASRHKDALSELIDAWVEPVPVYGFETLPIEGTDLVVIELIISAGHTLFGSSKPNETRRVYVRHHSRSVPARVREIENLVRSRSVANRYPGLTP